ncbi:MAG: hypothetical protein VB130_00635 [Clostridium sp.]|nr:hypothetical protein [Clostridium sp.]
MDGIVNIMMEDIKPLMYFIFSMFEQSNVHIQGTSSKTDLIGGYIDRWINRIPESLIFNKLILKNRPYEVINDYFIYNTNSAKNAPDVIGIKDNYNKIVKFAEFNDNTWEKCSRMPYIEVKTFRQAQKMLSVRDSQINKEHYYIIVESNFKNNYLKSLFKKELFNEQIYKHITMNEAFIKSNKNDILIQPPKVEIAHNSYTIGTLKLLGIIKGKDLLNIGNKCMPKETIYYIKNIIKVEKIKSPNLNKCINEFFIYNKKDKMCSENRWNDCQLINVCIEESENIIIRKLNKGSFYIETIGKCILDGKELESDNIYKIEIDKFERSSSWTEYIALKNTFYKNIDRTEELVNKLDKIYNEYIKN